MNSYLKRISLFASLILAAVLADAKITLPRIFSDGMVLQRDMPVKVWGTSDPNAQIAVKFGAQSVSAKADANGNWKLALPELKADKNPQTLSVSENGKVDAEVKNVLVGEVWILGGQSNMEWPLGKSKGGAEAVAAANIPTLRYFTQPRATIADEPAKDVPAESKWLECTPQNAPTFSGVGFYFARGLIKDMDVPVGLVYTALGATEMSCWIPETVSRRLPWMNNYTHEFLQEYKTYTPEKYKAALAAFQKKKADYAAAVAKAKAEGKKAPAPLAWSETIAPNPLSPRHIFNSPTLLYNGKIAPIAGFAARGVLWYQGESDAGGEKLTHFQENFGLLTESWRSAWGQPKMPFVYVQLASYTAPTWPEARWQQTCCLKNVSNVSMANIIDSGEKNDIHPKDKELVGSRLLDVALRNVYGKKSVWLAPMLNRVWYKPDGSAVVYIDADTRKLVWNGEPRGFEVRAGGKWLAAKPELKGTQLVFAPVGGKPVDGIRYLWKDWALPDVCLYNDKGLPAVSFIDERSRW